MGYSSTLRPVLLSAAAVAVLGSAVVPALARDPAVSATNLKLTALGGSVIDEGAWAGVAGLTAPLTPNWGVQGEVGLFGVDDDSDWGLAGHVFKRDPDSYLAGAFIAYAHEDEFDLEVTRIGGEVEFYLDQVTLLAHAGYQFADLIDDSGFGGAELRWYASNNFAVGAGVSFADHSTFARAHAEWLLGGASLPGLALRLEAATGSDDFDSFMGGITYYFGPDADLKDRHRRQDPDSALFTLFQSLEQERARQCAIHHCDAPLAPPPLIDF